MKRDRSPWSDGFSPTALMPFSRQVTIPTLGSVSVPSRSKRTTGSWSRSGGLESTDSIEEIAHPVDNAVGAKAKRLENGYGVSLWHVFERHT